MKISQIEVRKILDSRGEETIEVILKNENFKSLASVPQGKSRGKYEAICLSYEEIKKNLPEFENLIKGKNFQNSKEFDQFLIDVSGKNKEKFGANFVLACSLAFSRLLAKFENKELYEYLKEEYQVKKINIPRLAINLIGGGVHSFNNLDFQEYWLVSNMGFKENLLKEILEIIKKLSSILPKPLGRNDEGAFSTNFNDNFEPFLYLKKVKTENFQLGSDIAGNQINKNLKWNEIYEKLEELAVKYLEDPFKEDEFEKFAHLRKNFPFEVIGDDLTVTNKERLKIALEKEAVDGIVVKPNQIGTIFETYEFVKLARENNIFTVFSHRSGETNDDWLVDLCFAFGGEFLKIGPPVQGERVSKYNRLSEILDKI